MTAYDRIVDALHSHGSTVKANGTKATAQCPAHEDRNPSLSVTRIEGQVLVHDHGGCHVDAVLDALNLTKADLYDNPKGATYSYGDGRKVHRTPNKKFRQSGNTKGSELYRLTQVTQAVAAGVPVALVEGEKDVLALESLGAVATCSPMGAGKWHKVDSTPLHGAHVVVVADRDDAGEKHAAAIVASLIGKAASVRVVHARSGKDAADHVAAGFGLDDFEAVEIGGSVDGAELLDELHDAITKYVILPSPEAIDAVVLWVAASHGLPAFEHATRLAIHSPVKRCGKSRLLEVIQATAYNTIPTTNISVPALFGMIEAADQPPTLILDEADRLFGSAKKDEENRDLIAILNTASATETRPGDASARCRSRPSSVTTRWPRSQGLDASPTRSRTVLSMSPCGAGCPERRWRSSGFAPTYPLCMIYVIVSLIGSLPRSSH